jgi:hypothetical protein
MIQHNQIGKYTKKEYVVSAKVGRTYVLPSGKSYLFKSYRKEGRRYIFTITYKEHNCQIRENDYNTLNIEEFLTQIEKDILIK